MSGVIIAFNRESHDHQFIFAILNIFYFEKPFLRQELNLQISRALQFRKERGNVSTPGVLKRNGIVGESEEIKSCLDKVSIAAYSDTNLLISGGEGIGKELFAKAKVIKTLVSDKSLDVKNGANGYVNGEFPPLKKMMADTEKQYLEKLMTYTGSSVKKACDIAEVSRSGMYARLKKYQIQ